MEKLTVILRRKVLTYVSIRSHFAKRICIKSQNYSSIVSSVSTMHENKTKVVNSINDLQHIWAHCNTQRIVYTKISSSSLLALSYCTVHVVAIQKKFRVQVDINHSPMPVIRSSQQWRWIDVNATKRESYRSPSMRCWHSAQQVSVNMYKVRLQ